MDPVWNTVEHHVDPNRACDGRGDPHDTDYEHREAAKFDGNQIQYSSPSVMRTRKPTKIG